MDLELRLGESNGHMAGAFVTSHSTSSLPVIHSLGAQMWLLLEFLSNRRDSCNTQLMTQRTLGAERGRTEPFPLGLFAWYAAVCTFPSSYQKNNSSPLGCHSPFVQTFIIVCDTLCCIICLPALPLHKSALFIGRDCLVCVTPLEPSTVFGRLLLLSKYWLKERINA